MLPLPHLLCAATTSCWRAVNDRVLKANGTSPMGTKRLYTALYRRCVVLHELRHVHISRGVETKYLVRTLVQNLRVGANWRSVVGPVARATLLHRCYSKDLTSAITCALQLCCCRNEPHSSFEPICPWHA